MSSSESGNANNNGKRKPLSIFWLPNTRVGFTWILIGFYLFSIGITIILWDTRLHAFSVFVLVCSLEYRAMFSWRSTSLKSFVRSGCVRAWERHSLHVASATTELYQATCFTPASPQAVKISPSTFQWFYLPLWETQVKILRLRARPGLMACAESWQPSKWRGASANCFTVFASTFVQCVHTLADFADSTSANHLRHALDKQEGI